MKRTLTLAGAMLALACTGGNKDPKEAGTSGGGGKSGKNAPSIPAAPDGGSNRVKDFSFVATSLTAKGYPQEALFDSSLGSSWISKGSGGKPANIEVAFGPEQGVCVKKIGYVPGVFGNATIAAQTEAPVKVSLVMTQAVKASSRGKGPAAQKTELSLDVEAPSAGSSEIVWLTVPEVCKIGRLMISFAGASDDAGIAIAELYVAAD